MNVLNDLSDTYILSDKRQNTEIAHIELARWAVAFKIKEALDGDTTSLVESLASARESLELIRDYGA